MKYVHTCKGCGHRINLNYIKRKCEYCGLKLPYLKSQIRYIKIEGYGFHSFTDIDICYENYYCKKCGSDNLNPLELTDNHHKIKCLDCKTKYNVEEKIYYIIKD